MTPENDAAEEALKSEKQGGNGQTFPNPALPPSENARLDRLESVVEKILDKFEAQEAGILTALNEIKQQATPKAAAGPGHAASLSSLKELTGIAKDLSAIGEKGQQVAFDRGIEVGELRESIRGTYEENDNLRDNVEKIQAAMEAASSSQSVEVTKIVEKIGPIAAQILDAIAPRKTA